MDKFKSSFMLCENPETFDQSKVKLSCFFLLFKSSEFFTVLFDNVKENAGFDAATKEFDKLACLFMLEVLNEDCMLLKDESGEYKL